MDILLRRTGSKRKSDETGFTLLEVAIYTAIVAVLGTSLTAMVMMVSRTSAEGQMVNEILERNRVAVRRVSQGFRRALGSTVTVTNNYRTLTFNVPGGFDGSSATTGDQIRFQVVAEASDPTNNIDDDGDGLIDECVLTLTNLTTNSTTILSDGLSYANCRFVNLGWGVYFQISHMGSTKEAEKVTEVTKQLYLVSRN